MKLKKAIVYSIIAAVIMVQGVSSGQESAPEKKPAPDRGVSDDYTRDERIPRLYKRLTEVIQGLKLKPDDEGKYTFVIKAGNQYDLVDRVFLVYNKKADVYASQGRITKIVFEYYQFNMTTQVREIKTFTATAPDSGDLRTLTIEYVNTIGQKDKFTVAELQKRESRRDVIKQYYSYYLAVVYKLELYKDKTIKIESSKIDRAIQLGD
jgi:hypothetical protein